MSNTTQAVSVQFNNQTLTTFEQDNTVYTAVKPICENIGLTWRSQYNRIMRDEVLSEGVFIMKTPSKGGLQDTLCLPIHLLNGWLFGIDIKRVNPEIRDTLVMYKKECYQALHDYWNKGEAIKPDFFINETQQREIQEAVIRKVKRDGSHFQTVYHELKTIFKIPKYNKLPASQFDACMVWLNDGYNPTKEQPNKKQPASQLPAKEQDIRQLVRHTFYVYSWFKQVEQPLRILCPDMIGKLHGHITHAKIAANALNRTQQIGMSDKALEHEYFGLYVNR